MAMQVNIDSALHEKIREGMPALDLEPALRAKRRLGKRLGVHGPRDPKGQLITDGLVRLADKAALEYLASRSELLEFPIAGYLDRYHRAQDHFESFVQCLHRAMNYLNRLRSLGYRTADGSPLVSRPKDLEALSPSAMKTVREFRDSLEHLDKDILGGLIDPLDDVGPKLGTHIASIGRFELCYKDAVRWCEQIHKIAARLSVVQLTVGPVPDAKTGDA